ncbi:RidA family protein [Acidaminococcus timonensis]|jgi:2-iminobutanoate/2-iminopropanoate deaminase|uniref:RidA family protein n=1 Tax=Acidaminococcus timonensis TaxID=1871002 RepID=UPI003A5C6D61
MKREIINTPKAPAAVGPYVQGIKTGDTIYVSGQLGIDTAAGKLPDTVEEQAHCSMKNVGAILEAAGADYSQIVKTTIFLQDMNDFGKVNEIYQSYFKDGYPARSCVQIGRLPLGGLVEVECVAVLTEE